MTTRTLEIYGRGYLGNLLASALSASTPQTLATTNSQLPSSSRIATLTETFAILASGPSSVGSPLEELICWKSRLELWVASNQHRVGHVIYFSSAGTVYGEMGSAPHEETSPLRPKSDYGNYHAWAEARLAEALGDRLTILRLANIYGPRQRMKNGQGFITAAVRALETEQPLTIYGNGSIVRDYVHETDVVMLIKGVIKNPSAGVFNVASGKGTDQRSVASIVEKSFNRTLRIHYEASRLSDIQANILSIEKAKTVFGWKIATNLQDGIETYKEAY